MHIVLNHPRSSRISQEFPSRHTTIFILEREIILRVHVWPID